MLLVPVPMTRYKVSLWRDTIGSVATTYFMYMNVVSKKVIRKKIRRQLCPLVGILRGSKLIIECFPLWLFF
jgi:hypothetical protein